MMAQRWACKGKSVDAVGASSGPLYGTAFMRAGAAVKGKTTIDRDALADCIAAMAKGMQDRGKAERGEKTMMDAWLPAADANPGRAQPLSLRVERQVDQ